MAFKLIRIIAFIGLKRRKQVLETNKVKNGFNYLRVLL